jgi:tetratricopeptide (TPR) repeat protein
LKSKTIAFCALMIAFTVALPAQVRTERPYWFVMEQGKNWFRAGRYGDALLAFEDARDQRRDTYARMEQDMINLLSLPDVRRLADNLDWVELYIAERHIVSARQALDEVYYRYGRTELDGSVYKVLDILGTLKDYPEAEYWIGETYRAEGELGIALVQYRKAWSQRAQLEAPDFAVEILYKIADIHRVRQEYNEMEARLLSIIEEDALWTEQEDSFVRAAMTRTLTDPRGSNRINSFLTMYRYSNPQVIRAHRILGYYYYASNRPTRAAEHLMFVFLIQNSILLDEIIRQDYSYSFSTLDDLLDRVMRRKDLSEWIVENEYFKSMYYLGTGFFGDGKPQPARDFWTALSRREEAGEFRVRAAAQLRNPQLERAIEMP